MTEASSFDTEQSLLESLMGIFKGNDKTMVGEGFHKIIEGDFQKTRKGVMANEILFTREQAQVALDYKASHRFMIHEISIAKAYHTGYFPIQVSGRVDGTEGFNIHDTKTKFRSVDYQEYIDSCQWKFYLDMLGVDVFYYDLFEVQGFTELGGEPYALHPEVKFVAHEPLQCIRYGDMVGDIQSILTSFLEYLHSKSLVHLLKPAKSLDDQLIFQA
jgi:hypothetical protein